MFKTWRKLTLTLVIPGMGLAMVAYFAWMNGAGWTAATPTYSHWITASVAGASAELAPPSHRIAASASDEDPSNLPMRDDSPVFWPQNHAAWLLVGSNGERISGAHLQIRQLANFDLPIAQNAVLGPVREFSGITDRDGIHQLDMHPAATYEVMVLAPGHPPQKFRIRDPGRRVLRLKSGAAIWGRVSDENGLPLAGIPIEIEHNGTSTLQIQTDQQGVYEAVGVVPEQVLVRVAHPDYEQVFKSLTVEPNNRYCRDFRLKPGARLEVLVVNQEGQRVGGARVQVQELNCGLSIGSRLSDTEGRAIFQSMTPKRRYVLHVDHPRFGLGRHVVSVPVELAPSDQWTETIRLAPPFMVQGLVTSKEGVPISGTMIVFQSEAIGEFGSSRHYVQVVTNDDGSYFADGFIPALTYTAFGYHEQFALGLCEEPIRVAADGSPSVVDLRLMPPTRVSGFIQTQDGSLVPHALVTLTINEPGSENIGRVLLGRTSSDGSFSFDNVPPGRVWIDAVSRLHGQSLEPQSFFVEEQKELISSLTVEKP